MSKSKRKKGSPTRRNPKNSVHGKKTKKKATKKKATRKASRIQYPDSEFQSKLEAFRVSDFDIFKLLKLEPNKSETINTALREYYAKFHEVTCPTCKGKGTVKSKKV